jgi:hypothetical protein
MVVDRAGERRIVACGGRGRVDEHAAGFGDLFPRAERSDELYGTSGRERARGQNQECGNEQKCEQPAEEPTLECIPAGDATRSWQTHEAGPFWRYRCIVEKLHLRHEISQGRAKEDEMIVPNIRSSFGRAEAAYLIWILARGNERSRTQWEARLQEEGFDAVLDDPRTFNALLSGRELSSAPPEIVFYVLVRHALLEDGITDRAIADYLAALIVTFGNDGRAYHIVSEPVEYHYLTDIVAEGDRSSGRRAFMLRAHLGEFALWLSGLFPDHITARVQRRGAPGIDYFEQLGSTGYRMASRFSDAEEIGLAALYRNCADSFPALRIALNRIADRHIFPSTGDRIDRLLRQVADQFRERIP